MRITIAKEAFNKKISLLINKLNNFKKKLAMCYVCSIAFHGSETWIQRKLKRNYLESFEMWCWRRIERIKLSEKVTKEQILERIGEKRGLLSNILGLRKKAIWIGHILRRITLSTTTNNTHNPKACLWAYRFPASSLKYSSTTLNRPTYSTKKTTSMLTKYYIGTDMQMIYYSYTMATADKLNNYTSTSTNYTEN